MLRGFNLIQVSEEMDKSESNPVRKEFGKRILIIDDNLLEAESIKRILMSNFETFDVEIAPNWRDWESIIRNGGWSIVLLDIYLEKNNPIGLEIIPRIKEMDTNIFIVAMSNEDDIKIALSALDKGGNDFILKDDIFTMSGRFYTAINRIVNYAEALRNLHEMIRELIDQGRIFTAKLIMHPVKGILLDWTDAEEELSDDFIEFGIKAMTAVSDSPRNWADLPVSKTNYRAIVYTYDLEHEVKRISGIGNTTICIYYPSYLATFISDVIDIKKFFEEVDPHNYEELKVLKYKIFGEAITGNKKFKI